MTDYDAMFAEAQGVPGQRLKLDLLLAEMPDDMAEWVRAKLADPELVVKQMQRFLTKQGFTISESAIATWRRSKLGIT